MSDELTIENSKSLWPRRLFMGCALLVVLIAIGLVSLDFFLKRAITEKIEDELANNGWQVELGKFDYSILNMEVEFHDLKGESLSQKENQQFGQVNLKHVRLVYDGSRESKIGDITINGFNSKIGRIDHMEVSPDNFIRITGWTVNNPSEFGGGPLLEADQVNIEYSKVPQGADKRFKTILLDVSRINIVKNQKGQWLTDGIPKFQTELKKIQSKKSEYDMPEVDSITIKIGSVSFMDLSQSGQAKVVNVNQSIEENNNPKGYALGVFLRVVGVIAGAKSEADL